MTELEKARIAWSAWYAAKTQEGCNAVSIERFTHWYCGGDDDKAERLSKEIRADLEKFGKEGGE